jgi:hypothetical protein
MSLNFSFPSGIEQVQEEDDEGNPMYINKEIMGEVVIAEFRTPSLHDEVKSQMEQITGLNAQVAYLRMILGIEMEVGHE